MLAVKYRNIKEFKKEYLNNVFPSAVRESMRKKWKALQKCYPFLCVFHFSIEQILVGDPPMLVEVYHNYKTHFKQWSLGKNDDEKKILKKKLVAIFNYDTMQKQIAKFYSESLYGPALDTCYYCNMAYINTYTYRSSHKIHFDLDHYLDKGQCPILGLSMMNFVPSCQCCNEKIKRSQQIGTCKEQQLEAMPTQSNYDFDNEVEIQIWSKNTQCTKGTYMQNKNAYEIRFSTSNAAYAEEVAKMRYEERYQFHIAEALTLMDKKNMYPDSELQKIASVLKVSKEQVHEDIFGTRFTESEHRCFAKLKKDILK